MPVPSLSRWKNDAVIIVGFSFRARAVTPGASKVWLNLREDPPSPRGVSQLSCGQAITVRNFPLLGSGPILSRMWPKKLDTAAVSVGRVPSGACFGEPVEEFDPRPVRNNIGDAQPQFVL